MSYPRRRSRPRSRLHPRPQVEGLEARQLLTVAGTLDPSFGTGGVITVPIVPPTGVATSSITTTETAMTVGPYGQVDLVGSIVVNNGLSSNPDYLTLTQLNADGSRQSSFGVNGQATVVAPIGFTGTVAFVLPDGNILVGGSASGFDMATNQPRPRSRPSSSTPTACSTRPMAPVEWRCSRFHPTGRRRQAARPAAGSAGVFSNSTASSSWRA